MVHSHKWEYFDKDGNFVLIGHGDPFRMGIYKRHCLVKGCDKTQELGCNGWIDLVEDT